mmetsp:Transcript_81401/g.216039  ORF Transcript_81401/g.216039 Transcript_81401/m.216039 type:complete len:254 (+) Transcript_81401:441-1202(+)
MDPLHEAHAVARGELVRLGVRVRDLAEARGVEEGHVHVGERHHVAGVLPRHPESVLAAPLARPHHLLRPLVAQDPPIHQRARVQEVHVFGLRLAVEQHVVLGIIVLLERSGADLAEGAHAGLLVPREQLVHEDLGLPELAQQLHVQGPGEEREVLDPGRVHLLLPQLHDAVDVARHPRPEGPRDVVLAQELLQQEGLCALVPLHSPDRTHGGRDRTDKAGGRDEADGEHRNGETALTEGAGSDRRAPWRELRH